MMMRAAPMVTAPMVGRRMVGPMTGERVQAWGWHDHHFHNRFRNRNFVAFGFGGPIYDYAYDSCWSWVPTRHGLQWVNVCGDYYNY
jgi:hypothetical protein